MRRYLSETAKFKQLGLALSAILSFQPLHGTFYVYYYYYYSLNLKYSKYMAYVQLHRYRPESAVFHLLGRSRGSQSV